MKGLVLVGFMGTGKSAVSRLLAERLQLPWVDTDELIAAFARKTISRIFAEDGESGFRKLEIEMLQQLAAEPLAQVIATGGGIVLAEQNWEYLRRLGKVICLTALPETIQARVGTAKERPLLAGTPEEVRERIRRLLAERQPAYAQADWQCPTDGLTPKMVMEQIITWWQNYTITKG